MSIWSKLTGRIAAQEKVETPDYDFGLKAFRYIDLLAKYFRVEIHGLEKIPRGKAILVGNHNAGITFFDPMFLGVAWYRQTHGEDDFVYLVHDAMLAVPGLGTYLRKMGAARASNTAANEALESGRKIMVYPGGNFEAFRPFNKRKKIDLGNHKGFCKLALRHRVPIIPVVGVGSHETFLVLHRGEEIAKKTGLSKLLRVESFPIVLGLPWGISFGPMFHFPLPAKITLAVGTPIDVSSYPENAHENQGCIDALFDQVVKEMQSVMDEEYAKRKWPILG